MPIHLQLRDALPARVVELREGDATPNAPAIVGRAGGCAVEVASLRVAPRQCAIFHNAATGQWVLQGSGTDAGGGTTLNDVSLGRSRSAYALAAGDVIKLGGEAMLSVEHIAPDEPTLVQAEVEVTVPKALSARPRRTRRRRRVNWSNVFGFGFGLALLATAVAALVLWKRSLDQREVATLPNEVPAEVPPQPQPPETQPTPPDIDDDPPVNDDPGRLPPRPANAGSESIEPVDPPTPEPVAVDFAGLSDDLNGVPVDHPLRATQAWADLVLARRNESLADQLSAAAAFVSQLDDSDAADQLRQQVETWRDKDLDAGWWRAIEQHLADDERLSDELIDLQLRSRGSDLTGNEIRQISARTKAAREELAAVADELVETFNYTSADVPDLDNPALLDRLRQRRDADAFAAWRDARLAEAE